MKIIIIIILMLFNKLTLFGQNDIIHKNQLEKFDSSKISFVRTFDKKEMIPPYKLTQEELTKWEKEIDDTVIILSSKTYYNKVSRIIQKLLINSRQDDNILDGYNIRIDFYILDTIVNSALINPKNKRFILIKNSSNKKINPKDIIYKGTLNNKSLQYIIKLAK